jgi:three-Cys-motif partner protein
VGRTPELEQLTLFDIPAAGPKAPQLGPLRVPLWTEHKARLIQTYLRLFVLITKHGAYIDGFAAPQSRDQLDCDAASNICTAKLVLESEPKLLRDIWLCDADVAGIGLLKSALATVPAPQGRTVNILHGDFNKLIYKILSSGSITETTASFCLVDQRMFECEWRTLEAIASHKKEGPKIELFYFLGSGWVHRSIAGSTTNLERVEKWWGNPGWRGLSTLPRHEVAAEMRKRFREELGYAHVTEFPIYERSGGEGAVKYHMIHCSDHPEALKLMHRAYKDVTGTRADDCQGSFDDISWRCDETR